MAEYKVVNTERLDADLTSIAEAIRTKGGITENLEFPQGFVDAVSTIQSGGGSTEEIENIIDKSGVLESTDRTTTEKVEQLIDKAEYSNFLSTEAASINFQGNESITNVTLKADNLISLSYGFSECSNLVNVLLQLGNSKILNYKNCFFACPNLKSVETLDFSYVTNGSNVNNMFSRTTNIENLKIVPETLKVSITISSAVLTDESIQSIIDGLATVETAQTLTLHTDVKAKLTEEQLATITSKNWNLA